MTWLFRVLSAAGAVFLICCGGLPENFGDLPLELKIAAYNKHFRRGGSSLLEARAHISYHGWEAADLMIPYLEGQRRGGMPPREALVIIDDVQARGCDLAGTEAEGALERLLAEEDLPWDFRMAAEGTLKGIREGNHLEPGQLDGLTGGPCEEALAGNR